MADDQDAEQHVDAPAGRSQPSRARSMSRPPSADWTDSVAALEPVLLHTFHQPQLLAEALTHRSYVNEAPQPGTQSNERLEFLGDAVLGYLAADMLFTLAPQASEGDLTMARAALIRTSTLATFARGLDLGKHLRLGRGHTPASLRDRVWASTFEAILGALYLDGGIAAVKTFVEPMLLAEAHRVLAGGQLRDDKSLLQDQAQTRLGITPTYRVVSTEGPGHEPHFAVEVVLGERVLAQGEGRNKREAEQAAARAALADPGWLSREAATDDD